MPQLAHFTAPLPTAQEMRQWDSETVRLGIPECILMENASREALYVLQKEKGHLQGLSALLFMGSGNNGGDAACLARHLLDVGALPLVLHIKPLSKYKGVTKQHVTMAKKCGVPFVYLGKSNWRRNISAPWLQPDIIIDGLLGTGFEGALRPQYIEYVNFINAHKRKAYIFALDIPSGCEALTGMPSPASPHAVQAHATVCFAAAKPGLVLPSSTPYTGKLFVRAIGIPRRIQNEQAPSFRLLQEKRLAFLLHAPSQASASHKGTWGHVLVMGGSQEKLPSSNLTSENATSQLGADLTGAAHLTALAASRTGAGLVTAAAPYALCSAVKNTCPNIMTLPVMHPNISTAWPASLSLQLQQKIASVHALAIGPGMGTGSHAHDFLQAVLSFPQRPRAVVDADALTLLAQSPELRKLIREDDMLTPHPGEAARFLQCTAKDIQHDRFYAITQLAQLLPCAWLLKGAGTLIKQQESPTYILAHDIPALALAGSGDVLTGCTAALAARLQNIPSLTIIALAACVHATAGQQTQKKFPQRGHMASDLAHALPEGMQHLCDYAPSTSHEEVYSLERL